MSIIKAKLRQERKFISLLDVLIILRSDGDGCSIQEAATFLCHLIDDRDLERLAIYNGNPYGARSLLDKDGLKSQLSLIDILPPRFIYCENINDNNLLAYGFQRVPMLQILLEEGIHFSLPQRLQQLEAENARLVEQVADLERRLKAAAAAPQQIAQDPPAAAGDSVLRWPWGNHHTEALGHLEAAGLRFWQWFDPTDPTTAPTNETVAEWLISEHGLTKDRARSIASLLRADGLPHGLRR